MTLGVHTMRCALLWFSSLAHKASALESGAKWADFIIYSYVIVTKIVMVQARFENFREKNAVRLETYIDGNLINYREEKAPQNKCVYFYPTNQLSGFSSRDQHSNGAQKLRCFASFSEKKVSGKNPRAPRHNRVFKQINKVFCRQIGTEIMLENAFVLIYFRKIILEGICG